MSDTLPNKINKNENGVLNSDNFDGNWKHWIGYLNNDKLGKIYFFDSFGFLPSKNILNYLLTSGKPMAYNSNQIQNINSLACGSYFIEFIKNMATNKLFFDFIYKGSGIKGNDDDDYENKLKKVYLDPKSRLSGINE